jgi:hypothetical protein
LPELPAAVQRPIWRDYVTAAAEVRQYETLLLQTRPSGFARGRTADAQAVIETFRPNGAANGKNLLVLVNLDLGRWAGYPAIDLFPRRTSVAGTTPTDGTVPLDIDTKGQLVGFQALNVPRRIPFQVRLHPDETVTDGKTGTRLTPTGPADGPWHPFEIDVLPGSGRVLSVGPESVTQSPTDP